MLAARNSRSWALFTARSASRTVSKRTMAQMPVPQSSQAKIFEGHPKYEGWESTIAWWYPTSFVLICAVLATTPDTTIQSWAQEEAAARLKYQGVLEFGNHYKSVIKSQKEQEWDTVDLKALHFGDDDDDDDEDEEDEEDDDDEDDD